MSTVDTAPPPPAARARPASARCARSPRSSAYTTSTVSQQLAVLAREAGATLLEPEGRRVRLTPAGRRLAEHAVTILAAVEAARADLDPAAEPAGTVRVAGFATAIRRSLVPVGRAALGRAPRRPAARSSSTSRPRRSRCSPPTTSTSRSSTTTTSRPATLRPPALRATPLWSARWEPRRARRRDAATAGAGRRPRSSAGSPRRRLDRQLAQHRRRGRRPPRSRRSPGFEPADRPPRRQPRARAGADRGRARRRAAARPTSRRRPASACWRCGGPR